MDCHLLKLYYLEFMAGSIAPDIKRQIEEHLEICPDCRKFIQQEERLTSLLKLNPVPDPGDSYWAELENTILTKIISTDESNENAMERLQKPFAIALKYLIPLAAVIVIMIVSLTLKNPPFSKKDMEEIKVSLNSPLISNEPELLATMILSAPGTAAHNLIALSHLYNTKDGNR
jgi:hypothetical protein